MKQASSPTFNWDRFQSIPVVGILRGFSRAHVKQIISCYDQAGLSTIEITMNSEGAADLIQWASKNFGDRLNIGAGTVCTFEDLLIAKEAGASFIVTPLVEEHIIVHCKEVGIPVFPGAFSPTEIFSAWKLGGSMIKVFPSAQFGPGYLRAIHGPFPDIKLLPTGGISLDNIEDYLHAGASGLGMGGGLFPKAIIEQEAWDQLSLHFEKIIERLPA
ncbi:MAG: bifunctional 4-hydroxy-2-oxoglutarate aldolase/2-dehydro-3-deoxy-phosphogluconate aldolase [Bacteroidota bacterium]